MVSKSISRTARNDLTLWGISNYTFRSQVSGLKNWLTNRFDYLDTVINAYP